MSIDSSSGAVLPKGWQAFAAKPDDPTAKAVAQALETMSPSAALGSAQLIADTLAKRPAHERSTMSRLIMSRLMGDLARGFMRATAAVPLVPPAPEKRVPQHENVLHSLDLLPPEKLGGLPKETPGGRDRLTFEALDLAAAGQVTVDLVELERRTDDVRDFSSVGHLLEVLETVNAIGGKTTYSKRRRAELGLTAVAGTSQDHLVEQIGFRAAKTQRSDKGGLSPQNELAASYWRTNFRDVAKDFLNKLPLTVELGKGDILVNSPRVLRKLEMMVATDVLAGLTVTPLAGRSGVSVLSGTGKYDDIEWDMILEELGATPSAYQLYELMDTGKNPPKTDFTVDTRADLVELITGSPFSRLQEIARGRSGLAPVCAMIEHLVLGLTGDLGPKRFDTLTANAMGSLSRLVDIVVQNDGNPSVAMRAVDLMVDEIGLVLAAAQNYTWTDYRQTMRDILLERAPSIAPLTGERIRLDSHHMSSGMDALGTALWIALSSRDHGQVSRPTEKIDYFETGLLLGKLKKGQMVTPRDDVLIAALNPSTPFDAPSAEGLVSAVLKALESRKKGDAPFALILDSTIEVALKPRDGRTQLDVVLGGLKEAIAGGGLEVFLCKSFQKYASFGTGKVAAGDLTMLSMTGNLASAFARSEALLQDLALDLARLDEAQLVVHMLKHGHRDELALMRSASANAKFVDEFCWPIDREDRRQGSSYVDGIPLILRSTPTGSVDKLFENLVMIDRRDSFSFLRTSYVGGIPGPYARVNTGHESKETMVECFYALGHLSAGTPPGAQEPSKTQVRLDALQLSAVQEHLEALRLVPETGPAGIVRYRDSIVASYCAFAVQNVRPKGSVAPLLIAFFAEPAGRVTIETQRYLAGELFALVQTKPIESDPTVLAALCRAAVILPTWSFASIAGKLKLDQTGDSDDAKRLRRLVARALGL
ncbi:hypothetical protein Skr01_26810 [Sphaerisporangium krabiense]|uniref:Uncharacterized protein n=1 Tax=Sphaerisporangium krabiense TaxID=763782 RepID=A0A7W8ZAK3_9ACTN|nr:hypothetical protein [Sphaerisporangium krabiense]MBB5630452.1 hypothetical protein [Sphaerisporangium krabiense]GII62596.1 hypothetical protein Skr01_26810 [Sphaerisporangium krabiense]